MEKTQLEGLCPGCLTQPVLDSGLCPQCLALLFLMGLVVEE